MTDPGTLLTAAEAIGRGDLPVGERLLRDRLRARPDDPMALRLLAEVATRMERPADAETLLRRAVAIAPDFAAARFHLAATLYRQARPDEALAQLDHLIERDPRDRDARVLKAAIIIRYGDPADALPIYRSLLSDGGPDDARRADLWMSYGHAARMVGLLDEAVSAYRRVLAADPAFGEAWWSLANLKVGVLNGTDVEAMTRALARADISDDRRLHLHFALGKALEDKGAIEASFNHYREGNRIRRSQLSYSADAIARSVDQAIGLYTPALFAARQGVGCLDPDPIFIVGMPRSGSTLVEQILASHPLVEGTSELPDLPVLAERCAREEGSAWMTAPRTRTLGEEYLRRARHHRRTDRPFFIDKLPTNWLHVGFIHLILPRARIIDVRRHPVACCSANYKQHFATGQEFSYDQREVARYYADYARMMSHWRRVLPDRVVAVDYQELARDPEPAILRILAQLDLPFAESCLRPGETERAIKTPSAQQVRRPISAAGLDGWRHYRGFLGPMEEVLTASLAQSDWPSE